MNYNTPTPYTLKEFRQFNRDVLNVDELSSLYNTYLVEWKEYKTTNTANKNNYVSNIYKEFLKNIQVSNLSEDVVNYLNQIDYDDPYELDLAVHFFTVNLNLELDRISSYRDDLKFTTTKNNLKASPEGITKYLKAFLMKLLNEDRIKKIAGVNSFNTSEISNRLKINLKQYASNNITLGENQYVPNPLAKTNFKKAIEDLSKTTYQVLQINNKGSKKYLINSKKAKISINKVYSDWSKLPERFFSNENKNLRNLNINVIDRLVEKYIGTDVYYLSGNGQEYTLQNILKPENKNAYSYRRYYPIAVNNYGSIIQKDKLPYQLSFGNAGLAVSLSRNLTFNVDVSAVNDEYVIPDPYRIQPGIGLSLSEKNAPINFSAKTDWIKNNEENSINVCEIETLKSTGYQSRENSLKYSPIGINKVSDAFSFWTGENQIDWANADTYKRENFNEFPEAERFEDLLIKNDTATQVRNDVYGNEFILYKPTNPKRIGDSSYVSSNTTTSLTSVSCELIDGLYFNATLSAITAADPTAYTSLTGMYDTVLFNDNSNCDASVNGSPDSNGFYSFFAPQSGETDCDLILVENQVDGGPFLNHPCRSIDFIEGFFLKTRVPFSTISIPTGFATSYESTSLNVPSSTRTPLYNETYTVPGSAFVRDVNTQKVYSLYERLSGVFLKLPTSAQSAISAHEITNLDVIGSTIYFQTSASTFTEKYKYDGNSFTIDTPSVSLIDRYDIIEFYN
jgi:hypothetical protein